jgi:hypothetical protein
LEDLLAGGNTATESWNGTSWTTVNSMNTARRAMAGFGTNSSLHQVDLHSSFIQLLQNYGMVHLGLLILIVLQQLEEILVVQELNLLD